MAAKRLVTLLLILLASSQACSADELVLRSGKTYRGIVADRDRLAATPQMFRVVAILADTLGTGTSAVIRVDQESLDYVVLEDGEGKRVFDMKRYEAPSLQGGIQEARDTYSLRTRQRSFSKADAGALAFGGVALCIFGAAVKLGGAQLKANSNGVKVEEKSYNAANYCLMAGGGAVAFTGIVLMATVPSGPTSGDDSHAGGRPGVRAGLTHRF